MADGNASPGAQTSERSGEDPVSIRLALLESSDQISASARALAVSVTDDLVSHFDITANDEERAPFVVHVALALARAERHEPEPEVPDVVKSEVEGFPAELEYVRAVIAQCSAAIGSPVPEDEAYYVTAHVCALARRGAE
ncbi:MAG: hypothetical protein JWM85_1279 [Acidimicrobiaceae bacterium]|nr:hypothetical protein [Acidimicrobiaceae bacterium]